MNTEETPGFPGPVLNIHFQSRTFVPPLDANSLSIPLDFDVYHEHLGQGLARGAIFARGNVASIVNGDAYWNGGNVLTFPANTPYNVLPYNSV